MEAQIAPAPGHTAPWRAALDSQLYALMVMTKLASMPAPPGAKEHELSWSMDEQLLKRATPFSWSGEPTHAVLAATNSIPSDTLMNSWNLDTDAVWWYFADYPLPIRTLPSPTVHIRAITLGWIYVARNSYSFPAGSQLSAVEQVMQHGARRGLAIRTWVDDPTGQFQMTPSQTNLWYEYDTLETMLADVGKVYIEQYGKAKFEHETIGVDAYLQASEQIARFVLAGLAWLNQKVLTTSEGAINRHTQKIFKRETGEELEGGVKVISLRRFERHGAVEPTTAESPREYACRFVVDGHWRNQACGAGFADHRLTWISPYVKGPEDKPLRIPKQKVYKVDR